MAASVTISESNGAGESVTASVTNLNMGSTDAVNLVAATYPITAGGNAYEKYVRVKLADLSGSDHIKNIKVWRTGSLSGSDDLKSCAATSGGGYAEKAYAQPVASASSAATYDLAAAEPGSANLGIDGSLSGKLDANGEFSDYLVLQLQVDGSTTAGASCTINFKYEEVA